MSAARSFSHELVEVAEFADERIREGRLQRSLALIVGLSSVLSGLEVTYEHYRGSYSRRIMYTPLVMSAALLGAGVWAFKSERAAKTVLPVVSWLTLADCVTGFVFHVRGSAAISRRRRPGVRVFRESLDVPLIPSEGMRAPASSANARPSWMQQF